MIDPDPLVLSSHQGRIGDCEVKRLQRFAGFRLQYPKTTIFANLRFWNTIHSSKLLAFFKGFGVFVSHFVSLIRELFGSFIATLTESRQSLLPAVVEGRIHAFEGYCEAYEAGFATKIDCSNPE